MFGLKTYWDRKAREATEVEYLRRRVKVLEEERDFWKELIEDFLAQLKKIKEGKDERSR